jgi:L-alanine-DL-glutamate epimerase-like enolase superfamily enzyme
MKITQVEPIVLRLPEIDTERSDGTQDVFLVRIHTDEGITGIGEADTSPYLARTAIEMPSSHLTARGIAELLVGQDPLCIDRLWQRVYKGTFYYGRAGLGMHVLSAIDIALWDIAGKAYGASIADLLGGRRVERVRAYASEVMPETAQEVRAIAERAIADGYGALKLGWGPLGASLAHDLELIEAARETIGAERDLMLDGGQAYTVGSALELLERARPYDLYWFEEPIAPDDIDGYRQLSDRSLTPIAAGEADTGVAAFRTLAEKARLGVLQPDIARCGGFTVARQIRDLVKPHGPLVVPHCFSSGVLIAASLQVVASLDRPTYAEYSIADSPFVSNLLAEPLRFEREHVEIPTGPGLGIELDEELIEHLRYA